VVGNVAAGGERVGFMLFGQPCSADAAWQSRYADNVAHGYLVWEGRGRGELQPASPMRA
jgi:hypothetical protein